MRTHAARWFVCALLMLAPGVAWALEFPTLTGRVVDEAALLSGSARASLAETLRQHEQATTNQVVVVTLKSLQGVTIEEFGYQLGRHWGIGQKGKNNGALLIVAPNERKVRIEVGYGLEGTLTDAVARLIIENEIIPKFRAGRMADGVVAGATAVVGVLEGRAASSAPSSRSRDDVRRNVKQGVGFIFFIFGVGLFAFILYEMKKAGNGTGWPTTTGPYRHYGSRRYGSGGFGSGSGGSWGGGGFGGGGGFSGGGGGFGGGGASGGW